MTNRLTRAMWSTIGVICVGIGGLGIVVPGLPTTIFFIVAAGCFSRSSPRLERWVLDLPRIGPLVRDHRAGLGMPSRAKRVAIGSILVFGGVGAVVTERTLIRVVIVVAMISGITYLVWAVPTRDVDATP